MHETETVPLSKTAEKLFLFLLFFYPKSYRKHFGQEMFVVFQDVYKDELREKGSLSLRFWTEQLVDMGKSIISQHMSEIQQKGIKKYLQQTFHVNTYNLIGGILLLPFFILFSLDVLGRIVQGDMIHYNRAWYSTITHSLLYKEPFLLQIVLMYAPIGAVILNLIPLIRSFVTARKFRFRSFLFANMVAAGIILVGLFFLSIVYGHDVIPCIVHGLFRVGIGKLFHILAVCVNV